MSTQTTSRAVDPTSPRLRAEHRRQHERAFQTFFRRQAEAITGRWHEGASPTQVFDVRRWNRELEGVLFDELKDTAAEFGTLTFRLLGGRSLRFDPDLMDAWLEEVAHNSAEDINTATLSNVEDALDGDEPLDDLTALFAGLVAVRAGMYAVSTVTTSANFGAHDGARAGGALTKTWQTNSGNSRPEHAALDGMTIPMSSTFPTGQRWPGDPAGGVENNAGCQCSLEFAA